jgi:cobalt/nickel transport system permease protein
MKIVAAFTGIIIIVTEPLTADPVRFILYLALVTAVVSITRLPVSYLLKRLLVVTPFILMAAVFYPLSIFLARQEFFEANGELVLMAGAVIFMKAFLAVTLLILLSSTERFHRLLLALRKLKFPSIITTISALLYQYIFLIADETLKTTRARSSRTPGRLRMRRIRVIGNQVAVIFLRSWERAQIVYQSMLSRGFSGEFPVMVSLNMRIADIVFPLLFIALLLAVRLFI